MKFSLGAKEMAVRPDHAPAIGQRALVPPPGLGAYLDWMAEREMIRLLKESKVPPPWTSDPILGNYYFTNVMREHDRVSRWIHDNITIPGLDNPSLPIQLGVARWINRTDTLEFLMESTGWMWKDPESTLVNLTRALDDYPFKIYGGAYVISANGMRWGEWGSKHDYVIRGVCGEMVGWKPDLTSMQAFTEGLDELDDWGGFMSYEVACDLRWARGWLDEAPDIYTWANPGPGALRGLMNVYGMSRAPGKEKAIGLMRELLTEAQEHNWSVRWDRALEMRDIEHTLCEFNKYERIRAGGRPKRLYHPR